MGTRNSGTYILYLNYEINFKISKMFKIWDPEIRVPIYFT